MDLFELIFIALFILLPIMEGVSKSRKKRQQADGTRGRSEADTAEGTAAESGGGSAAEMLPDDLWEVMTGRRREPDGEAAGGRDAAPWSPDPGSSSNTTTETGDWREEPWVVDDEATAPEPVSAEYEGPEAYSLETPAARPVERHVPSAEARHRAFHELINRPKVRRRRTVSPLMRSLSSPQGLRDAVVIREILGPPKGLE